MVGLCCFAGIAGYVASGMYRKMQGSYWVWCINLASALFAGSFRHSDTYWQQLLFCSLHCYRFSSEMGHSHKFQHFVKTVINSLAM